MINNVDNRSKQVSTGFIYVKDTIDPSNNDLLVHVYNSIYNEVIEYRLNLKDKSYFATMFIKNYILDYFNNIVPAVWKNSQRNSVCIINIKNNQEALYALIGKELDFMKHMSGIVDFAYSNINFKFSLKSLEAYMNAMNYSVSGLSNTTLLNYLEIGAIDENTLHIEFYGNNTMRDADKSHIYFQCDLNVKTQQYIYLNNVMYLIFKLKNVEKLEVRLSNSIVDENHRAYVNNLLSNLKTKELIADTNISYYN